MIKNGTRLQSQVCDTQVIVVRSADSLDDLRAGGAPMIPIGDQPLRRHTRSGAVRWQPDGQALCRRDGRRGAGDQGGGRHAVGRDDAADGERGQAPSRQRLS